MFSGNIEQIYTDIIRMNNPYGFRDVIGQYSFLLKSII